MTQEQVYQAVSHLKQYQVSDNAPRKVGVVESDSREKSRKVTIHFSAKHLKYGKYLRKRTVIHAHDEENVSRKGDRVEIAECRPISKTKSWIVLRVIKTAS